MQSSCNYENCLEKIKYKKTTTNKLVHNLHYYSNNVNINVLSAAITLTIMKHFKAHFKMYFGILRPMEVELNWYGNVTVQLKSQITHQVQTAMKIIRVKNHRPPDDLWAICYETSKESGDWPDIHSYTEISSYLLVEYFRVPMFRLNH